VALPEVASKGKRGCIAKPNDSKKRGLLLLLLAASVMRLEIAVRVV
jgi:hypothetical protein